MTHSLSKTLAVSLTLCACVCAQITTLTQSSNPNVLGAGSVACTTGTVQQGNQTTQDNGYFRSYPLTGITQQIDIVSIRFGVQLVATTSPSGFPLLIRLYNDTNAGAPSPYGSLSLRHTESFTLPVSATNTIVTQPMTGTVTTFNPNETIVVEVFSPFVATNAKFFIGSNALGQTAPGYLRAPLCGLNDPGNIASPPLAQPNMHIIIDVNYVPHGTLNPYPGTNEDLSMSTGVNANPLTTGPGLFVKNAFSNNTVQVKVVSGGNTFNYKEFVLLAQGFNTGSPPFPPAAPNIWMTYPNGLAFMIGGPSGPLGPVLLPPGGITAAFLVPPGLAGTSVIFQGAVVASNTLNGLYAVTNGHVFSIL